MNKKILLAASAIALVASAPALAETTQKTQAEANAEAQTTGDISNDAKKAWKNVKADAEEAYEDIKAVFVGDQNRPVTINTRHTAYGMIGKGVYNGNQEKVGTVKDIIVDKDGNANMLIIADGEFTGYDGKLVAFDYGVISRQDAEGDIIAPISEENINKVAEFSYDRNERADGKVRVIPDNGYSVSELLDGQLLDPEDKNVAEIDDISFRNGKATVLVVGFDKVLGMGGKKAALDFDAAKLVRSGDDLDFKLTAEQAAQFESFKKTAVN